VTSSYHTTGEAAAIVESVERHVREARAVLATTDREKAVFEAQQLLLAVDEMLGSFPAGGTENHEGWTAAVALRDELGGYLLAATTLAETGVAPHVVTELLERGAALAEGRLDRLGAIREARPA
jgi:hypothetical protein